MIDRWINDGIYNELYNKAEGTSPQCHFIYRMRAIITRDLYFLLHSSVRFIIKSF